jgi:hypothetical protein
VAVDVTKILGQPCKPSWTLAPIPPGTAYAVWLWEQTIQSPPIAIGSLSATDLDTYQPLPPRTFRILCNREIAVVHPDDAGWLVRKVEPYMKVVKPIWAQYSKTASGLAVDAGLFSWLPGSWTCPECWPKIDKSGDCSECTVARFGGPSADLRKLYGYDPRAMLPWAANVRNVPSCGKGGPGGPDTLCMPVDGFCQLLASAKDYVSAFWQDVAQAVQSYNSVQDGVRWYAQQTGQAKPPQSAAQVSVSSVPVPRRAINFYPLLAAALGAGIFSVFLARR